MDVTSRWETNPVQIFRASELSVFDSGCSVTDTNNTDVVRSDHHEDMISALIRSLTWKLADFCHDFSVFNDPGDEVRLPNEFRNERTIGQMVECFWSVALNEAPPMQHGDLVGHRKGFIVIVGHQDRRGSSPPQKLKQFFPHFDRHVGIEVAEGFVQQQEDGIGG